MALKKTPNESGNDLDNEGFLNPFKKLIIVKLKPLQAFFSGDLKV